MVAVPPGTVPCASEAISFVPSGALKNSRLVICPLNLAVPSVLSPMTRSVSVPKLSGEKLLLATGCALPS